MSAPTCPVCKVELVSKPILDRHLWVYQCECGEKLEEVQREKERERAAIESLQRGDFPPTFIEAARTGQLDKEKIEPHALAMSSGVRKETGKPIGLFLHGDVGTGKTWSGCYCAWRWALRGHRVLYLPLPASVSRRDRVDVAAGIGSYALVHVDDLGYQKYEASEYVFLLVDAIYRAGVPVIYSTSQSPGETMVSLGARRVMGGEIDMTESAKAIWDRLNTYEVVELTRKESLR